MIAAVLRLLGALIILGFVVFAIRLERVPLNLLYVYLVLGTLSFFNYWRDKRAAKAEGHRVPERSLQLLDLVFGIVGGLVAQVVLRHKISKPQFAMVTGLITALHAVVLALLIGGVIVYPGLR